MSSPSPKRKVCTLRFLRCWLSLVARRNEAVLVEVDGLDLVVEGEIDPRQAFRLKGGEADRCRPIEKAPVQFGRAELPEGEAAIGDEEVRLVEFAELDAETVVLDQEGVAALGAVGHEQEFFAAELDRLGAANLGQPERFLLDGQLFKVERATRQGCQVIRALDGVVAR